MKNCEHFEMLVSSWLDDELERSEQVELMDHVIGCAGCREFYAEARSLDGIVAVVREPGRDAAPPRELWHRIRQAGPAAPAAPSSSRIPAWALRAAAVMVLAVGLTLALIGVPIQPVPAPGDTEIRIGEDAGKMTDARFVNLTREMLRADSRYHSAMFQIMDQVVKDTGAPEASSEGLTTLTDYSERPESESSLRTPS